MTTFKKVGAVVFLGAMLLTAPAAHAATATYTYDALGRVVQVVYSTGYTVTYTYDANGNRTAKVVS